MSQLGIVLGSALIVVGAILNIYSLKYINVVAKETESNELTDIGEKIGKSRGRLIVTFLLFATCIVPLIIYIDQSTTYFENVLKHFGYIIDIDKIRLGVASVIACLCMTFRTPDKLKIVNTVGLMCILAFTSYVVYFMINNIASLSFASIKFYELSMKSLTSLSIISFAYCSQFSILSITSNIESVSRCNRVIEISNIISCVVYLVTGICGCIAVPDVGTKFFPDIPITNASVLISASLGIVNIMTYPIIMIPTLQSYQFLQSLIYNTPKSALKDAFDILCLVMVCFAGSYLVASNDAYLYVLFFFCGSCVMFALPAIFYFIIMKKELNIKSYLVIIMKCILTIFGIFMGFYTIKNDILQEKNITNKT